MTNQMDKQYICPMHPEVVSDKPGRCPKCGMSLIEKGDLSSMSHMEDKDSNHLTWNSYTPLIVIIALITISVLVANLGEFTIREFIIDFMTGFFLVFAGFKLMDLKGFAEGYSTYDLLAKRLFTYGYVYPFIELAFGLIMLSGFHPNWLLWTEFGIMTFSGLGVALKLARKEKFQCACLGTFLKVPLTYVTLVEDFGMAILALTLILLT